MAVREPVKEKVVSLLPTQKRKPQTDLSSYSMLIYGDPKTGKSTLASKFDDAVFLATEAGLNALEVYEATVDSWEKFGQMYIELARGEHPFKTIVVDTVGNLFKFCSDYVCRKNGIKHESELDWGKGWSMVRDEFLRAMTKLTLLPYGVIFIGHTDHVEIKTRTGSISKAVPQLSKGARETLLPMVDFIFYCSTEQTPDGYQRIIHTKPTENWEAGDRTGKLPSELPMDYDTLIQAFEEAVK